MITDKITQEVARLEAEINKIKDDIKSCRKQQTLEYRALHIAESEFNAAKLERDRLNDAYKLMRHESQTYSKQSFGEQQNRARLFWEQKRNQLILTNQFQSIVNAKNLGDSLYILRSNNIEYRTSQLYYPQVVSCICAKFANEITKVKAFLLAGTETRMEIKNDDSSVFLTKPSCDDTTNGVTPFTRVYLQSSRPESMSIYWTVDDLIKLFNHDVSSDSLDIIKILEKDASKQLSDLQRICPELSSADGLNLQLIEDNKKVEALKDFYQAEKDRLWTEYDRARDVASVANITKNNYQIKIEDLDVKVFQLYQEQLTLQEQLSARKADADEIAKIAKQAAAKEAVEAVEAAEAADAEDAVRKAINNKDFHALIKVSEKHDYSSQFDKGTMDDIRQVFSAELNALRDIISSEKGNERQITSNIDILSFHHDTDGKIHVRSNFEGPNWSYEKWNEVLTDGQLSLVSSLVDSSYIS